MGTTLCSPLRIISRAHDPALSNDGKSTCTAYKFKRTMLSWTLISCKGEFVQKCFLLWKYILILADYIMTF